MRDLQLGANILVSTNLCLKRESAITVYRQWFMDYRYMISRGGSEKMKSSRRGGALRQKRSRGGARSVPRCWLLRVQHIGIKLASLSYRQASMLVRQQREEDFVPKRLDSSWLSSASERQTLVVDLVNAIARAKAQRTDWQGNHRLCIMNILLFRSSSFAGVRTKHNFKRSVGLILNIKRTLNLSQVP
jgi:hypothetical protein